MKFRIEDLKFRNQIVLFVSIIFLLICAITGVAFYHLSAKSVTENFEKSAEDAVRQMENTLETRLGIIEERSKAMLINSTFSTTLAQFLGNPGGSIRATTLGTMADYLRDFEQGEELISSSYLYTKHGDFDNYIHIRRQDFSFEGSPYQEPFLAEGSPPICWLPPMEDRIFREKNPIIPCVRKFSVPGYYGEQIYFVYQLDQEKLWELLVGQNEFFDDIVIVDPQGEKILGGDLTAPENLLALWETEGQTKALLSSNMELEEESYLVESCAVEINGWKLFALKSRTELLGSLHELAFNIFKIAFAVMAVGVGLVLWVSKRITDGLSRLERQMSLVRQGDLTARFFYPYHNEIGSLSRNFNYMIGEIEDLVQKQERAIEELRVERNRVEEVQKQKRKAELKALQAQINPHFLYNTLNAITWDAMEKGMTDVGILASSLGKFFRLSLSKGAEIITLSEEAEHVRSYLKIQGIRYKDRLRYEIDVPPELLVCRVLKLILQPLVENAIYHGIKEKRGGGLIRVEASRREIGGRAILELSVWDDGAGIPAEKMERMNRELESGEGKSGDGYGIYNVNERVMIYFGTSFGLRYESEEGQYTRAVLTLPVTFTEEAGHV